MTGDIYVLFLNDMRSSQIEIVGPRAKASSPEALIAFYESERVEPYTDGLWRKSFRAGGPLEWCNQRDYYGRINNVSEVARNYLANFDEIPNIEGEAMPERNRDNYEISLFIDAAGKHQWRQVDKRNGEIVGGSTEGYSNKSDCEHNLYIVTGWYADHHTKG